MADSDPFRQVMRKEDTGMGAIDEDFFHGLEQFADIAGPVVARQGLYKTRRNPFQVDLHPVAEAAGAVHGQFNDIELDPLRQPQGVGDGCGRRSGCDRIGRAVFQTSGRYPCRHRPRVYQPLPFLNDGESSFILSMKSIRRCRSTHFLRRLDEKALAGMIGGGSSVADLNPSGISGEGRGHPGKMGLPNKGEASPVGWSSGLGNSLM